MVLNRIIILLRKAAFFILIVVFFSCEKPLTGFINCSQCTSDEPITARIEIRLSSFTIPTVNIYEGYLEDSILYESFTTSTDKVTREVPLNKKYTLTACYRLDNKDYIVVNSVSPRVLYDEESCDEPCYYIYDKFVNLRLRYTE